MLTGTEPTASNLTADNVKRSFCPTALSLRVKVSVVLVPAGKRTSLVTVPHLLTKGADSGVPTNATVPDAKTVSVAWTCARPLVDGVVTLKVQFVFGQSIAVPYGIVA